MEEIEGTNEGIGSDGRVKVECIKGEWQRIKGK
jgi:hypothetical protein